MRVRERDLEKGQRKETERERERELEGKTIINNLFFFFNDFVCNKRLRMFIIHWPRWNHNLFITLVITLHLTLG